MHAVPTPSTATVTDAVAIIRDMCLRSGSGVPDVLMVDHDAKFAINNVATMLGDNLTSFIDCSAHPCSGALAEPHVDDPSPPRRPPGWA